MKIFVSDYDSFDDCFITADNFRIDAKTLSVIVGEMGEPSEFLEREFELRDIDVIHLEPFSG